MTKSIDHYAGPICPADEPASAIHIVDRTAIPALTVPEPVASALDGFERQEAEQARAQAAAEPTLTRQQYLEVAIGALTQEHYDRLCESADTRGSLLAAVNEHGDHGDRIPISAARETIAGRGVRAETIDGMLQGYQPESATPASEDRAEESAIDHSLVGILRQAQQYGVTFDPSFIFELVRKLYTARLAREAPEGAVPAIPRNLFSNSASPCYDMKYVRVTRERNILGIRRLRNQYENLGQINMTSNGDAYEINVRIDDPTAMEAIARHARANNELLSKFLPNHTFTTTVGLGPEAMRGLITGVVKEPSPKADMRVL